MTLSRRTTGSHRPPEVTRTGKARKGGLSAGASAGREARPSARSSGPRGKASRPHLNVSSSLSRTETPAAARRTSLTGRAAVLALVVCMLAISLAYPLREYLAQRGEIADYRAQVTSQSKRVAELEAARDRWQSPAYVRAQARERLHFVMPGETQYVVLEPDEAPVPGSARRDRTKQAQQRPWFGDLWRSVEVAGRT